MLSKRWTLQSKNRLLEISSGGRWYLFFTLGMGVAAIYSSNKVIFLLESLLLSSLILSGVLSELTVASIEVSRVLGNIHASTPGEDTFIIENRGRFPLYCIELGEYLGNERVFTAFLVSLPSKKKVKVRSRQVIAGRGRHRWDGILISTSFPFGFARKIRTIPEPGSRIVWPKIVAPDRQKVREERALRGDLEVIADEVCPVEPWHDVSRVHWPVSARVGSLMARPERHLEPREEVWLSLRDPGPEMERAISQAAGALSQRSDSLVLLRKNETQKIEGRHRALDTLALLPKEESA